MRICEMTIGEIERKFDRYDLKKRAREAEDLVIVRMVPMPDRTPKRALKLAKKIWPDVKKAEGETRMRMKDLLPLDKEWKKAARLYARLERLDETCEEMIDRCSHSIY